MPLKSAWGSSDEANVVPRRGLDAGHLAEVACPAPRTRYSVARKLADVVLTRMDNVVPVRVFNF